MGGGLEGWRAVGCFGVDMPCQHLDDDWAAGQLDWRHAGTKVGLAAHCRPCSPAAQCHTRPAVQVVHPSREAEQLRSQLLGLIRNALQPLQRDRVGCVPCDLAAAWLVAAADTNARCANALPCPQEVAARTSA